MAEPLPQENVPILLKDTESGKVITVPGGLTPEHTMGLSSGKYQQVFEKPVNDNTQINSPARELNTLYDTTTGQVVRLPLDKIPQAIVEGTVGFKKGERINMVNEAGESVNLPSENVAKALSQGYGLEHPNQTAVREYVADNQGISGTLKVGLGQFVDEGLMGLPEIIYDHTADPLEVAKKEALKNQHQVANTLGGIAGFGASLLYGGELVKGATIVGRGAERAILSGAERGAERLGGKLVLEGGEKLAEQGVKGLVIKGVDAESAKLAREALQAFEEGTIKNVQENLIARGSSEMAAKAAAPGIARRIIATTVKYGVEGGILSAPQTITEEMLGDHKAAAESLIFGIGGGAALGYTGAMGKEFLSLTKKSIEYLPEVMPQAQKLVGEKLSPEGMRLSAIGAKTSDLNKRGVDRLMDSTREMASQGVFDFGKGYQGLPTFGKITERLENINRTSGEKIGDIFAGLDERMAANPLIMQDAFNPGQVAKKISNHFLDAWGINTAEGRVIDPVHKAEFKDINKWIKSLEMRGETPITFEEARKIKGTIADQTKWDHTVNNSTNWNRQEVYNIIKNELDDSVGRVGKRVGDESLLDQYTKLKNDWGNSNELLRIIDKEKARQIGNRLVGLTDTITGSGLTPGSIALTMATGNILHLLWPIAGVAAKKALESSVAKSLAAKGMEKAGLLFTEQTMKRVAEMIDEIPKKMEKITPPVEFGINGMARFLGKDAEGKDKYEQFKAIQQKLTEFHLDPSKSADRIGKLASPITNGAPKISEEYVSQMVNLYNYLYAKMPKNNQEQMPFKKIEWKPSDSDISKFSKVLMTVDNPFTVMDDVMNGTVTKDQVEALKVIYPSIYAAMANKINDVALSQKVTLPYETRLKLSLLMGINLDTSLSNVNAYQANFAPPAPSGGKVPRGAKLDIVGKNNPYNTPVGSLLNKK